MGDRWPCACAELHILSTVACSLLLPIRTIRKAQNDGPWDPQRREAARRWEKSTEVRVPGWGNLLPKYYPIMRQMTLEGFPDLPPMGNHGYTVNLPKYDVKMKVAFNRSGLGGSFAATKKGGATVSYTFCRNDKLHIQATWDMTIYDSLGGFPPRKPKEEDGDSDASTLTWGHFSPDGETACSSEASATSTRPSTPASTAFEDLFKSINDNQIPPAEDKKGKNMQVKGRKVKNKKTEDKKPMKSISKLKKHKKNKKNKKNKDPQAQGSDRPSEEFSNRAAPEDILTVLDSALPPHEIFC